MKHKIIEDDTPGLDRCAVVSRESAHQQWGTNNIRRHPDGRVERLPALCGPGAAGAGEVGPREAFQISDRATSRYMLVCGREGHVRALCLTNGRSELTAQNPWERRPYHLLMLHKVRACGFIPWHGNCLVRQLRDGEISARFLLTRKDLPADECEPVPDGPCACKEREQAARRAKHEAKEREFEDKMTARERDRDLELSERSAKAMADAIKPLIEKLAGEPERRTRKKGA